MHEWCTSYIFYITILTYTKEHNMDAAAALEVCRNLHDTLKAIRFSERYSGVRKAIVASCMGFMFARKIASVFKV